MDEVEAHPASAVDLGSRCLEGLDRRRSPDHEIGAGSQGRKDGRSACRCGAGLSEKEGNRRLTSDCETRSAGRPRKSATASLPVYYSVATPTALPGEQPLPIKLSELSTKTGPAQFVKDDATRDASDVRNRDHL